MKQQILFKKGKHKQSTESYTLKLPKVIKHVSPFEMQFGFKQPMEYFCGRGKNLGEDSKSIPGYTNNIRL